MRLFAKKTAAFLLMVMFIVSVVPVYAYSRELDSPVRIPLKVGDKIYQIRGIDGPHEVTDFDKFPGYKTYVHSNCYHFHGEIKKLNKKGREISSSSLAVPIYCKGLWKHAKEAFTYAKDKLGISVSKFLKLGGVLALVLQIPGDVPSCNSKGEPKGCMWRD